MYRLRQSYKHSIWRRGTRMARSELDFRRFVATPGIRVFRAVEHPSADLLVDWLRAVAAVLRKCAFAKRKVAGSLGRVEEADGRQNINHGRALHLRASVA